MGEPMEESPSAAAELARRALDLPRVTLDELAAELDRSRSALKAYRTGDRQLPAEVAQELATWLRRHAAKLESVAEELESVGRSGIRREG